MNMMLECNLKLVGRVLLFANMPGSKRTTVLDIKRVENAFFHTMYIFSVVLHAIDKHDISK